MSRIVGLNGQYAQIRRKKTGEVTCGGDQGFFAGAPARSADERKNKQGCGITALADVFLYLAGQDGSYAVRENAGCINRILSEEEYKDYYNRIYEFAGGLSPRGNNGLTFIRLQSVFNRMARRQKWPLYGRWGFCGGKIYDRILDMLDRDVPVILCMPYMVRKRDKSRGAVFYTKKGNNFVKAASVSAHYVVVTGVLEENGRIYLEISSWGKRYYIDRAEYETLIRTCFLGTILGNMLYVKRRK